MTPAHRQALEGLIGKQLTAEQLAGLEPYIADPDDRNDVQIAALLSVGRKRIGSVSKEDFASWVASTGLRSVIEDEANNPESSLRSIALTLRDALAGSISQIRMDLASNLGMVNAWVEAGELTETQRDDLLRLAEHDDPYTVLAVSHVLNVAEDRAQL